MRAAGADAGRARTRPHCCTKTGLLKKEQKQKNQWKKYKINCAFGKRKKGGNAAGVDAGVDADARWGWDGDERRGPRSRRGG